MPKSHSKDLGTPVIIANESGQDVVREDDGKEIRYTKDFGCGIDCHNKFIEVNVLVKNNLSVFEYRKSFDTDWESVNQAKKWVIDTIKTHSNPVVDASEKFHYTIESTSAYHCVIIKAWGGNPSIVNPTLARAGSRKTDILDARTLAVADLTGVWPTSYIPSIDAVELRMLVDERKRCMYKATQISNQINNSLLKLGINIGRDGSVTKNQDIRSKVEKMVYDDVAESEWDIEDIPPPPDIPSNVRCIFQNEYEEYNRYCNASNSYFQLMLEKVYSMNWETENGMISGKEMMNILTSAPGIGDQTAILWLSRVITPCRFPNAKALAAYCGCDPSLKVSAGKVTSTVKRGGRKDLHSSLCMAASNLMRRHSEPFGIFGFNIAKQTGIWKKGVSAVARKLTCALYFMALRNERFSYEKYKMIVEPDVLNVSVETLCILNPSFKRYIRCLIQNDIKDTKQLVHKYYICELTTIKGFGKNFFALVKDFINDQKKYQCLYEGVISNENNQT